MSFNYDGIYSVYFGVANTPNGEMKNTWAEWRLLPAKRPNISPPDVKTHILEIAGADGDVDLSTALTGFPTYENRTGSIQFYSDPADRPYEWDDLLMEIKNFLHGRRMHMVLASDFGYYYEGRFAVSAYGTDKGKSTISIDYTVAPYKLSRTSSTESWLWDPFNFRTGVMWYPDDYMWQRLSGNFKSIGDSESDHLMLTGKQVGRKPTTPVITFEFKMDKTGTYFVDGDGAALPYYLDATRKKVTDANGNLVQYVTGTMIDENADEIRNVNWYPTGSMFNAVAKANGIDFEDTSEASLTAINNFLKSNRYGAWIFFRNAELGIEYNTLTDTTYAVLTNGVFDYSNKLLIENDISTADFIRIESPTVNTKSVYDDWYSNDSTIAYLKDKPFSMPRIKGPVSGSNPFIFAYNDEMYTSLSSLNSANGTSFTNSQVDNMTFEHDDYDTYHYCYTLGYIAMDVIFRLKRVADDSYYSYGYRGYWYPALEAIKQIYGYEDIPAEKIDNTLFADKFYADYKHWFTNCSSKVTDFMRNKIFVVRKIEPVSSYVFPNVMGLDTVGAADATMIQRIAAAIMVGNDPATLFPGKTESEIAEIMNKADANRDGNVTAIDAQYVNMFAGDCNTELANNAMIDEHENVPYKATQYSGSTLYDGTVYLIKKNAASDDYVYCYNDRVYDSLDGLNFDQETTYTDSDVNLTEFRDEYASDYHSAYIESSGVTSATKYCCNGKTYATLSDLNSDLLFSFAEDDVDATTFESVGGVNGYLYKYLHRNPGWRTWIGRKLNMIDDSTETVVGETFYMLNGIAYKTVPLTIKEQTYAGQTQIQLPDIVMSGLSYENQNEFIFGGCGIIGIDFRRGDL